MNDRAELIETVVGISKDASALLDLTRNRAATRDNLSPAEIGRIDKLIQKSEETVARANELAKARRAQDIEDLKEEIRKIESTLSALTHAETVEFLKRRKRNLRAQLLDKQLRVALDFGGILSAAEFQEIKDLLAEGRKAVKRRKKAEGFIKTLFQVVNLSGSIVRRASGIF